MNTLTAEGLALVNESLFRVTAMDPGDDVDEGVVNETDGVAAVVWVIVTVRTSSFGSWRVKVYYWSATPSGSLITIAPESVDSTSTSYGRLSETKDIENRVLGQALGNPFPSSSTNPPLIELSTEEVGSADLTLRRTALL